MDPLIETYKIFVESVKAEFGEDNARPIIQEGYEALCEAIGEDFSIDPDAVEDLAREIIESYLSYMSEFWSDSVSLMAQTHKFVARTYALYKEHPISFTLYVDPFTSESMRAGGVDKEGKIMELLTFGKPIRLTELMVDVCQGHTPDKMAVLCNLRNFLSNGEGWRILTHELTHMAQHAISGLGSYNTDIEWIERKEEQEALLSDVRNYISMSVRTDTPFEDIMKTVDAGLDKVRKVSHNHDVDGLTDYVHEFAQKLYDKFTSPYNDEIFDKGIARMKTMEGIDKMVDLFYRDDSNGLRKNIIEGILNDLKTVMPLNKENMARAKEYAIRKADEYMKTHYGN